MSEEKEPVTTARQAGRVVRIALLTALLLNTAGVVRAALGMSPGPTKDLLLGLAKPLNTAAHALDLDRPRTSLDAMLGHPDSVTGDGDRTHLERDAARQPIAGPPPATAGADTAQGPEPRLAPVAAAVRHPTPGDPLRILVTGDSLSDFDGQQLARLVAAQHLPARVRVEARNGTGLTQPDVFDWADEAAHEAASYDPDVVVMVLGANDGWPVAGADVGSSRWVAEYSRRVEAVARDFLAGDPQRRVYWVGPPVPRSAPWIHIFDRINAAVRAAVPTVPGLRYVDVAGPTSDHGRYTDYLVGTDGRRVLARQHDGIHFSFAGSVFPARIILAALHGEYTLG
ncbi:SGNH/GDSL hydrolase family protein [Catenulispora subtropica]|uniref:SGNH hydrolase-type esterase domain-containing protein n=1 Tax=Catenulispora subtropica TaxID=450798 RepID=A0ABN2T380_9ACTN